MQIYIFFNRSIAIIKHSAKKRKFKKSFSRVGLKIKTDCILSIRLKSHEKINRN